MTQNFEQNFNEKETQQLKVSDWIGSIALSIRTEPELIVAQLSSVADCLLIMEDRIVELEIKAERLDELKASVRQIADEESNVVAFKPSEHIKKMNHQQQLAGSDDGGDAA